MAGDSPGVRTRNAASQPTVFRRPSLYRSCQKRTGRHICSRALYRGRRWLMTKLWGQTCHAEGPPAPHRQAWPPVYRCSCLWAPRIWPGHGAGTSCREGRWQGRGRGLHPAPVHGVPSGPASSLRWTSHLQAWPWLFCPLGRCFSTVAGAATAAPPAGSLRPLPGRQQCPQTTQPLR